MCEGLIIQVTKSQEHAAPHEQVMFIHLKQTISSNFVLKVWWLQHLFKQTLHKIKDKNTKKFLDESQC